MSNVKSPIFESECPNEYFLQNQTISFFSIVTGVWN